MGSVPHLQSTDVTSVPSIFVQALYLAQVMREALARHVVSVEGHILHSFPPVQILPLVSHSGRVNIVVSLHDGLQHAHLKPLFLFPPPFVSMNLYD